MSSPLPQSPVANLAAVPHWLNLANLLTLSRLVLAFVLFGLMAFEMWIVSLGVFGVAAFTDWLDGYVARRQGLVSSLGRVLDPLVDKVLICGAFVFLLPLGTKEGWLLPWMVTVVIARELIISGLRDQLESMGAAFGADMLGKIKMTLQCAALIAIFVALEAQGRSGIGIVPQELALIRDFLIWAMVLATVLSGANYLVRLATPSAKS
ncbi:MAG: CDP-diacylglycerol--glycerol-3-phosphate 3-phosphatidyltransferase [Gemmataceae bacterium]|nr:MAG: CDP-diacylglycerol--glycerol-3-phosphate 3-phosphatidyltransferase [Planctomycetota bacterium]